VSSYTITITPDDAANASATLHVNLGASGARITELTVRAGDGEGFAPDELPGFELSRLIGAITPATVTRPVLEARTAAEPETTIPEAPIAEEPVEEPEPPADAQRPLKARRPAKSARAAKSTRAPAEKTPAEKVNKRKAAAAKAAASKATGAARAAGRKAAKAGSEHAVRAYRRMPDDVVEVYRQAGGATAMANHYGVPTYTAQGWLRRLRQRGDLPS
jgi:outer membrane biosynthesis protein TonB